MPVKTCYEHVGLNETQVPVILGTKMKVIELILAHLAYGWSPEELHFQFSHLSMGQIYSALAYYWDHREEIDKDVEDRLLKVDNYRRTFGEAPLVDKLRGKGVI